VNPMPPRRSRRMPRHPPVADGGLPHHPVPAPPCHHAPSSSGHATSGPGCPPGAAAAVARLHIDIAHVDITPHHVRRGVAQDALQGEDVAAVAQVDDSGRWRRQAWIGAWTGVPGGIRTHDPLLRRRPERVAGFGPHLTPGFRRNSARAFREAVGFILPQLCLFALLRCIQYTILHWLVNSPAEAPPHLQLTWLVHDPSAGVEAKHPD